MEESILDLHGAVISLVARDTSLAVSYIEADPAGPLYWGIGTMFALTFVGAAAHEFTTDNRKSDKGPSFETQKKLSKPAETLKQQMETFGEVEEREKLANAIKMAENAGVYAPQVKAARIVLNILEQKAAEETDLGEACLIEFSGMDRFMLEKLLLKSEAEGCKGPMVRQGWARVRQLWTKEDRRERATAALVKATQLAGAPDRKMLKDELGSLLRQLGVGKVETEDGDGCNIEAIEGLGLAMAEAEAAGVVEEKIAAAKTALGACVE